MSNLGTKTLILNTVARLGKASVNDVVKNLPESRSRQWTSNILQELAKEEKLIRNESGRFVFYVLPNRLDLLGKKIERKLKNKGLSEDIVFNQINSQAPFINNLGENLHSILEYSFTEMLNNAIEHSKSKLIAVSFEENKQKVIFEVMDKGIGVFKNVMRKYNLKSELEAIQELTKGKTTTLPNSHSGEGIFFTSKIADIFILDSFGYRLRIDNNIKDLFVEKLDLQVLGTRVRFEINKNSKKHLNDVFREYESEPGSHSFDKTKVHVKLFKAGSIYISRSQARRLMANLNKFKLIILDFNQIKTVGQAFADEVFRVFSSKNPKIKIEAINMSEGVQFMINRTRKK